MTAKAKQTKLTKSKERVSKYGEVFTPDWVVEKMITQPEIMEKLKDASATFLEPAAGEGAFLMPLVRYKLKFVAEKATTLSEFNNQALVALASLYGIELLEDNFKVLVKNMKDTFQATYEEWLAKKFQAKVDPKVVSLASQIIDANIVQGDTLKGINKQGDPIMFNEWKLVGDLKFTYKKYSLDNISNGEEPLDQTVYTLGDDYVEFNSPEEGLDYLNN